MHSIPDIVSLGSWGPCCRAGGWQSYRGRGWAHTGKAHKALEGSTLNLGGHRDLRRLQTGEWAVPV